MSWTEAAIPWLPTLLVAALGGLAAVEALLLPERARTKRLWGASAILLGALAAGAALWQQKAIEAVVERQAVAIGSAWSRLAKLLPPESESGPGDIVDQTAATITRLNKQVETLNKQVETLHAAIKELQQKVKGRVIDEPTAAEMTEYFRQFHGHRVVVSCVPGNVEAYDYANQIANILRAADWDAAGPEATAIFAEAPAMGVSLYVHGPQTPDAARILLDAFAKFNIPFQSRIAPSQAIPDAETVELFVGPKP